MWQGNKYRYGDKTFRRKEFDTKFSRQHKGEREYTNGNNWKNNNQHHRSHSPNFAENHRDRSPLIRQSHRRQRYTENRAADGYHRRGTGDNAERKHGWHRKERRFSPSKSRYRSPSIGNANYDTKPKTHGNQSNVNADKISCIKDKRTDGHHYGSTDKDEGASTPSYDERYFKSSSTPNYESNPVDSELQTMDHGQSPEPSGSVSNSNRYNDAVGPTRMRQTYFSDEGNSTANHKRYLADPELHTMSHVQIADARNRQNDVLLDSSSNLQSAAIIKTLRQITVIDENTKIKNEFESNCAIDNTDLNVIAYPLDEQHFLDANGYILNTTDVLTECERIGATVTSMCYKYIPIVTEITANINTELGVEKIRFWARKGLYAAHNEL